MRATMRRTGRALVLVWAAAALAACGALSGSDEPWSEPSDYTYEATITVFGPSAGRWRVTVRDHEVAAVEPLDELARSSGVMLEDFSTFADYEDWHAEALERGAAVSRLARTHDGALKSYEYDGDEQAADDEYLVVVSEVTVP
ncbi:DUF6174 domain-containing protein [Demequina rhizosphaerae]|uniref:DUF6174 domain-containing protein n=1 Tax=Demequina rhizosphaerae TaxID=1638985 RepID=UPI000A8E5EA7|nr:DUF6174 domain-containing protein [Demequina rhizosphaerae]